MCQHEMVFGCLRCKMNMLNNSVMHIMHSFDVYSTIQHAECIEVGIVLRFNTCRSCAKSEFIFVIGRAVLLVSHYLPHMNSLLNHQVFSYTRNPRGPQGYIVLE